MLFAGCWSHNKRVNVSTLIVSQALIQHQDGVSLHPDLFAWEKQLSAYRQHWFDCADKNPLAWYASLCETSPTALLAQQCDDLPEDTAQYWVASPYHAQLARTAVRVMPEGQMPWAAEDANELCEMLNPLLAEDGMQLLAVGAALLLACRESIQANPKGFGEISGQMLPDRNHAGEDGCHLNRLLSEIQMLLFQHPSEKRRLRGDPDVSGLWLWSPIDECIEPHAKQIAVATRNPVLHAIAEGKDASVIITEAERMGELVHQHAPLPMQIVLAGDAQAVLLTKSILPTFGKRVWKPKSSKPEDSLFTALRRSIR